MHIMQGSKRLFLSILDYCAPANLQAAASVSKVSLRRYSKLKPFAGGHSTVCRYTLTDNSSKVRV
jgi:hypothetical protein